MACYLIVTKWRNINTKTERKREGENEFGDFKDLRDLKGFPFTTGTMQSQKSSKKENQGQIKKGITPNKALFFVELDSCFLIQLKYYKRGVLCKCRSLLFHHFNVYNL